MTIKKLVQVYIGGYLVALVVSFVVYYQNQYIASKPRQIAIATDILLKYDTVFSGKEFLLVNFWAIDCKTCNSSMQSYKELALAYKNELEILSVSVESPRQLEIALKDPNLFWAFMSDRTREWLIVDIRKVHDLAINVTGNLVGSYLIIQKSGEGIVGEGNCLFYAERMISGNELPLISLRNAFKTLDYKLAFVIVSESYFVLAISLTIIWFFFRVVKKRFSNRKT